MSENNVLVRVQNLKKHFPINGGMLGRQIGAVKAVDGISFDIKESETLGMVGESGCGKSTAGRAILQLHKPTAGQVFFKDFQQMKPNTELILNSIYRTYKVYYPNETDYTELDTETTMEGERP